MNIAGLGWPGPYVETFSKAALASIVAVGLTGPSLQVATDALAL